jgi:hypothetical protein
MYASPYIEEYTITRNMITKSIVNSSLGLFLNYSSTLEAVKYIIIIVKGNPGLNGPAKMKVVRRRHSWNFLNTFPNSSTRYDGFISP